MENINSATPEEYDRRKFIAQTSKGIIAAGLMGSMLPVSAHTPTEQHFAMPADETPVQLKPLFHPSEKQGTPPPAPLPPDQRIRFALVGLGHLTLENILPAFGACKKARPVALVSGDRAKAEKVAAQYGIVAKNIYNYKNFDDIKNNPEIDAVYIVLPNSMHEEFTIRAAKAGKHVLCEKPMSNTSKEAQRMIDACKLAGKKLMIAYRIQYEPKNNLAKQWTREKKFGTPKLIEATNVQNMGDPTQWRLNKALAGGGPLPDVGIYNLNTIRFLLGEEPDWVFAKTHATPGDARFKEVEESILFQLHFPSGTLANCSSSYGVHDAKRYRVFGDKGGWFGMDPAFSYTGLKMEVSQVVDGKEWKQQPSPEDKDQFAVEMDHMATCILENKQPFTPGEEGLQDMKIIEAIYRSAKEGKPVELEKISGLDVFRGPSPDKTQA